MTIETTGIIAELIAALAVVVSLIYLAIQVKRSSNQGVADMTHSVIDDFNRIQDLTISSPQVNSLLAKLRANESIDEEQSMLLLSLATRYLTHWFSVQSAFDHGLLDEHVYQANCEDVERMLLLYPALKNQFREIAVHFSSPTNLRIFGPIFN